MRLDAIERSDVLRWRDDLAVRKGVFNRVLPLLAVMLGYEEKLRYRPKGSNPCKGVARYKRKLPERYLSKPEYRRLWQVLAAREAHAPLRGCDQASAVYRGAPWRDHRFALGGCPL
ncbi:hypothetical protein ACFFDA_09000 (plasmid) [Novosphingobium sp. BL-52-GroH]